MCDCTSGYTYNGLPYTGREGNTRRVGQAEHVVKTFCNPVHNSGINVTTDNWFTSTKLAEDLLLKQITLLRNLRKNKPDIPKEFATGKNLEVVTSLFVFRNRQTLVSYLNIAGINSMVIFRVKFSQGESQATHGRRVFLKNLGMSLLHPWLQRRVQEKQLPKDT